MPRVLPATLLAALALAPPAGTSLPITYVPASRANYDRTTRDVSAIRLVVVHVTEGSYPGTIAWFRNPHARASANYVVSREGAITEMVRRWNVAWHAGNGWVNRHSIGIEHEGYTRTAATVTDAEYRASAELVASILRRYLLPVDRRHVIGHNEVPDPVHPWLGGGWAHHTDPGRFWDWSRYMGYVRSYARGNVPPPRAFDVTIPSPALGATLRGAVAVDAVAAGSPADHVDFLVDGKLRTSERELPYAFDWDTGWDRSGRHTVRARAVAADGRVAEAAVVVKVKNPRPRIVDVGLVEGQVVAGLVHVQPALAGTVRRLELVVDGVVEQTVTQPPFGFEWETTSEAAGPHRLVVRAYGAGLVAQASVGVVVANPATG